MKWQKHVINGNNKWSIDDTFRSQMLLQNGNFVILHPNDECPHFNSTSNQTCKFHHGVRIIKNNTSMSFVFRVATSFAKFRKSDNTIFDHGITNKSEKEVAKQKLYKSIDIVQYHKDIKCAMSSVYL